MNTPYPHEMTSLFAAKEARRQALAALPYEEKLRILLHLQRIADAIRQTRGLPPQAWPLDSDTLLPTKPSTPS
ncbi:hypothetical protein [Sulfobacillus thermosulfidooxidans]|uniref:hypothetical protein n=1 Tax=Sulfobacillus thermosulfidooxidans TaxID=28034 RepID=UPI0006B650D1|nr:hypothetical protein [Sulfobacillus thermosulfidooxidans]